MGPDGAQLDGVGRWLVLLDGFDPETAGILGGSSSDCAEDIETDGLAATDLDAVAGEECVAVGFNSK